jgi:hypothetical protein
MRNPIKNAKIVPGFNPLNYTTRKHKRGDKAFVMSRSQLHDFAKCPSKWIKGGGQEDDSTRSTEWGTLIDTLVTGDGFSDVFVIHPDTYPSEEKGKPIEKPWNRNSKWCRNWIAEHAGRIVISAETLSEAKKASAIFGEAFSNQLTGAKFQVFVSGEYHDKDTGLVIPVCGLIDAVPPSGPLKDIKTARSADLARWGRVVNEHWYDAQGAMYLDLWNSATGETREEFDNLIQENSSPYEIAHASLSVEFLNMGRAKYRNALRLYAQCLASGHYATYNDIAPGLKIGGKTIVSPEAWMQDTNTVGPIDDPDWMTEAAA